jgi:L-fuconolactonase
MVFVQADCLPEEGYSEAQWVNSLAPTWRELSGIVAFAPVERGDGIRPFLDKLRTVERVVGIRRLLQNEALPFFRDPTVAAGLRAVGAERLAFDACVRHWQLPALAQLIASAAETTVVLDHLGKPPIAEGLDSEAGRSWLASVRALARSEQVVVKLSGLAPEADPSRALGEQVVPFAAAALDIFGADKVMLGSDWPVSATTPHRLGYAEWFELMSSQFGASSGEWDALASRTATRVYGLED